MAKVKVDGHTDLLRDTKTNAIINSSTSAYSIYMKNYKSREKNNDMLRNTVKEINSIKNEMKEIKSLLTKVLDK
jgi:hypothetical protein